MTPPTRCQHALRIQHCAPCSTRELVHDLLAAADWLASSVIPGTGRTWQPPVQYEDTRTTEQRDHARLERLQRVDIALGETPPMLNFEVMDLLSEVLVEADRLSVEAVEDVEAALIRWAGPWARKIPTMRLPDASSALADPAPYLRLLDDLLEHIADLDLLEHIADRCHRLVDRANRTLGLYADGQLLDAHCPWCGGRTERHPEGGRRTLRIRMSLPTSEDSRPVIVCEGGRCEPGANSGERWKGLPAWDLLNEGEWLGQCIRLKDDAAACRCGLPVLRSGKPGRPAQHCSEQCRRDADSDRQRAMRASA